MRDRTAAEILARLTAAGVPAHLAEATVARLQAQRYLDDRRLALEAARRAAARGFGSERVRAALEARGIDARSIDCAVEAAFLDEVTLARALWQRRFAATPQSAAARARGARFLLGRGFPEAIVLAIVEEGC
jgi:SOS response regulatory protein OraA/RecX